MKEKKSNIGKYLLILVPFVMGVTGFYGSGWSAGGGFAVS